MNKPLIREHVLGEIEFLADVEHALVVEYLTVFCALGHDLDVTEGGPTSDRAQAVASAVADLALGQMFRLKAICFALVAADRSAELGRAPGIASVSGVEIPLDPPSASQLARLLEREESIATALDARYVRLIPAVTSHPVFDGELLDTFRRIIAEDGPTHATALDTFRDALGDSDTEDILRATRRHSNDAFEQRLLDLSDRIYRMVVASLRNRFASGFGSSSQAVSAMECLDQVNRILVQRGLLPPFTQA